jgi:hypothetical protein
MHDYRILFGARNKSWNPCVEEGMSEKLRTIPTLRWVNDGEDWVAQITPKTSWYRINTWDNNYELWVAEANDPYRPNYMFIGDFPSLRDAQAYAKTHEGDDS